MTDTRTRILDSALRLLEAGEGNRVRMGDIARAAGISRQAVYLHFASRAELLTDATRHLDALKNVDARLAESRAAPTGVGRLDRFIEAWGGYIPEIYGVARALLAMMETDTEAEEAWNGRMQAMREGCAAAISALARDGTLHPSVSEREATDLLWTLLSVRNWEQLRHDCGWPQERYIASVKAMARRAFVAP